MNTLVYKDYFIIAEATRDEISGKYKPIVLIAWYASDGKRNAHSLILRNRCTTFDEATAVGTALIMDQFQSKSLFE
jgi:hypothetical protein